MNLYYRTDAPYILIHENTLVDIRDISGIRANDMHVSLLFRNGETIMFQDYKRELFNELLTMFKHVKTTTDPKTWKFKEEIKPKKKIVKEKITMHEVCGKTLEECECRACCGQMPQDCVCGKGEE